MEKPEKTGLLWVSVLKPETRDWWWKRENDVRIKWNQRLPHPNIVIPLYPHEISMKFPFNIYDIPIIYIPISHYVTMIVDLSHLLIAGYNMLWHVITYFGPKCPINPMYPIKIPLVHTKVTRKIRWILKRVMTRCFFLAWASQIPVRSQLPSGND